MKNQLFTSFKNQFSFYLATILLIVVVIIDPFHQQLVTYLENQIDSITLSLGILLELKALASSSSSSHLPLISGISASSIDALTSAIQYLSWSDLLVTMQLVLIALSQSTLIQVTLFTALIFSFIPQYKSAALKVLVLLLLVNPGLPIYVSGVQHIAREAKLDQGNDLSQELEHTRTHYQQKEAEHKEKEIQRDKRQLAAAEANGEPHISRLKKLEDKAADEFTTVGTRIEEGVSEAYLVLKTACKAITVKTINLFTAILIQFILLPFVFFYGLFTLFKKFTSKGATDEFLEKTILFEALFVLIFSLSQLI